MNDRSRDVSYLPPARPMPPRQRAAQRALLEAAVARGRRPPWRSRTAIAAATAVVVLSGATATAYVTLTPAPATSKQLVRCYTVPELGGQNSYFGTDAGQAGRPGRPGPVPIENPVGVCAALWRQGWLTYGARQPHAPAGGAGAVHPVPPLVGCVLSDGVAAVFPGGKNTCARLGLPRLVGQP